MIRIPHLETDVTTACQLSCVACNHHVPLHRVAGPKHADWRTVGRDLRVLAKILLADRWGALGGEPTLNPHLGAILDEARASGVAPIIEVWTNGIRLMDAGFAARFFDRCDFDVLVLSAYPGVLANSDVAEIGTRCAAHGRELSLRDERANPNFKTLLEPKPTGHAETRRKFAGCFFRHFSRVANDGVFYTCCCAPHMPSLVQGRPVGSDGVEIAGLTEDGLRAYLEREEPLGACYSCAGRDTAVAIPWSQERDPKKWLAASGMGGAS